MFHVKNKVALVTGGASGIEYVTAKEFLKNGVKGVTIADVDIGSGQRAFEELAREFGSDRVVFIKTYVTCQENVEAGFNVTIQAFGNLDIVVNSAGICRDKEWEKEITINIAGTIRVCLLAFEKYLPIHKGGDETVIVNISSTGGLLPRECLPVYSATKNAILGFSRSLGTEKHYKNSKVRVLTICPGETDTPLITNLKGHLLGPHYEELYSDAITKYQLQEPEEVAKVIVQAIQEGKNGSVWLVRAGRSAEVKLPDSIELIEN